MSGRGGANCDDACLMLVIVHVLCGSRGSGTVKDRSRMKVGERRDGVGSEKGERGWARKVPG